MRPFNELDQETKDKDYAQTDDAVAELNKHISHDGKSIHL